jgi:hypothetical protein
LHADSPLDALADFTRAVAIARSLIGIATCFGARSIIRPPPTVWSAIALWALLAFGARPLLTVSVAIALSTARPVTFLGVISVIAQFPNAPSEFVESLA